MEGSLSSTVTLCMAFTTDRLKARYNIQKSIAKEREREKGEPWSSLGLSYHVPSFVRSSVHRGSQATHFNPLHIGGKSFVLTAWA